MCNVHSAVFEHCLENQQGSQLHHCHPSQARICMKNGSSPKGQRVGTLALIQEQQWATPAGETWFSVVYLVDWWPAQPAGTQRGRGLQERLNINTHGGLTNLCGQLSTAWPSQQLWERGHSPGNQLKLKFIFPLWCSQLSVPLPWTWALNWDLNQALHPGISLDSMDSFPWLCNHKQLCPNLLLAYLLAGHTWALSVR